MENAQKQDNSIINPNTSLESEDKEKIIFSKLGLLFQDYLLSEVQSIAVFKYIKDIFLYKDSKHSDHVKQWVLMKVNNKSLPLIYDKNQIGCPDLVPGLTIKSFWDPYQFDWIKELLKHFHTIKEELISLRESKGFQPYKSPKYASDFKVTYIIHFIKSPMII